MASQGARFGEERREEFHRLKLKIFHVWKLLFAVIHFQVAREISAKYPSLEVPGQCELGLSGWPFGQWQETSRIDGLVGHLFTTNLRGWYPSNLTSILAQLGQQAFLEICFLLMKVQLSVWMLGELSDLVPGSPGELTCMVRRGHGRWISYKSVPLLCTEKNCLLDGTQEFNATDMRVLEDWRDDPHPPDCYRFWQATKSERSPFPVLWCFLIEGTLHHLR